MQDVIKAWELRQERIQSVRFYLDEEKFLPKGSEVGLMSIIRSSGPLPKDDLSFHVTQIVTLDGPKIRHSSEGVVSWDMKGEPFKQSNVIAFDGEASKNYFSKGTLGHPGGEIIPGPPMESSLISLLPLFVNYRATYPGLRLPFKISDFEKTKEITAIDGSACVALRMFNRPPARGEETLWVDPERDFLLRRYTSSVDGKVHLQLDIHYEADARHGWVPSAWRFVYYLPGGILNGAGDTKVVKYEINIPVDPGEFDITFPPGTVVSEHNLGKTEIYLVKGREEKRVITDADRGKSYQDVFNEDSDRMRLWKRAAGLFAMALIIALVILWYRRSHRPKNVSV